MGSRVENELIKAAWALSKSNNEVWHRYLVALDNYTRYWTERAVGAPSPELHIAVGMARQALEFNQNMQILDDLNEKIKIQEDKRK